MILFGKMADESLECRAFIQLQALAITQSKRSQSKWRQYVAGVAASMGLLASGAWFTWPAPLLPHLVGPNSSVPMTLNQASWMVSCVELGNLFSPFPATFISDRYGRKFCMLLSVPIFFVSLILTIYVKTVLALSVARALQGFAMGIPYTILPLYLGEIASPDARGTVTSFFHIFWGIGCLIPYCAGPFLSYDNLTYATFSLTVLFVLCFIWQPESPFYYALQEKTIETTKALKRLRDPLTEELVFQKELEEIYVEVKSGMEEKPSCTDIFKTPAERRALLLLIIVGIVSFFSGQNAILTYTTETFSRYPNNLISPDMATFGIGLVALLGSTFSVFTSDRFGRRFLLLISSIGCSISLFVAAAYFYLTTFNELDLTPYSWLAPVAIMGYNLFVTAGMHPVCVTYTSELFPTNTRGLASSISSINLTFCSFLVLKSYETVSVNFGVHYMYLCYAVTCFVGIFLFYFMFPETKGKTFLEIQEALVKSQNT